MPQPEPPSPALRALVAAACLVVVVAGLKAAGDVILPILFSVFLSIATLPAVRWLQSRGVPTLVAIPVVVVLVVGILVGVSGIIAGTVRSFTADVGQYEQPFNALVARGTHLAESLGIEIQDGDLIGLLTPGSIMDLVGSTVQAVVGLLGRVLVVAVTLTFILFEASELEQKVRAAFGTDADPAGPFADAGDRVQRYLVIKTLISAITGLLAGLLCRVLGVDFWVMWGLIAFLLNYIPSIGSIVAAVPPILLAVVQLGWDYALAVTVGYLSINVALGNFIEPRLMGQSLGLSPLVVFLSLIFWGWLWGPVGMLLCVPMTVMAKLVLDANEDTRWIAVFLGPPREARHAATAVPAPHRPEHGDRAAK